MFWSSVWAMTAIDVAIIAVVVYAMGYMLHRRGRLVRAPARVGFVIIFGGLAVLALFYFADLVTMHLLPVYMSDADAMAAMRDLHLEWSWLVSLLGIGAIAIGLVVAGRTTMELISNLQTREQQLSDAQRIGRIGHWRVIVDSGVAEWSDQMFRIWGFRDHGAPIDLNDIIAAIHPDDRAAVLAARDAAVEENRPYEFSFRITRPDGEVRYVHNEGRPEFDADGKLISIFGISQDVTEQQRVDVALRESEQRFRDFANAASDWFWETGPDLRYTYLSQVAEDRIGMDLDAFLGRTPKEVIGEEFERQPTLQEIDRCMQARKPFRDVEFCRPSVPDGEEIWLRTSGAPYFDDNGSFGGFRGSTTVITEDRRAEEAIRRSEQNFRAIAQGSPVPLLITRYGDSRILYANPLVGPVLGIGNDNILGRRITEFFWDPEERGERAARIKPNNPPLEAPLDMRRADGTRISTVHLLQRINYAGEDAILGSFQDVTERQRMEEQLRQAQKMEAVGQLTGGIAHDFNNLLGIIMGNLELLLAGRDLPDSTRELSQRALSATQRGAELTHQLLAFSRRQPLQPVSIDANQLLSGMHDLLRRTLGEAVEIELVGGGGLWKCEVDRGQLENAILNLSINARDAMPEGGRLTIETSNARLDDAYAAEQADVTPGQYVLIAVSDTGAGMPQDIIEHAFDPFFTTKEVGKGSGLGLSMVYGFVKQSGGHARIYSELNEGTTMKLYLPRATSDRRHEPTTVAVQDTRSRGEVVLVVEDDAEVRQVAVDILEHLGYDVMEAGLASDALSLINPDRRLDMLLTDVILPGGMGGRELVEQAIKKMPDLKVLYMSGYTENAIMHHGRLDDGVQLLAKPFGRNDLAVKVRQILDESL